MDANIEQQVIHYAQLCKNKNFSTISAVIDGLKHNNSSDHIVRENCVSHKTVDTIYHTYNMIGGNSMLNIANHMCMDTTEGGGPPKVAKKPAPAKVVAKQPTPAKVVAKQPTPAKIVAKQPTPSQAPAKVVAKQPTPSQAPAKVVAKQPVPSQAQSNVAKQPTPVPTNIAEPQTVPKKTIDERVNKMGTSISGLLFNKPVQTAQTAQNMQPNIQYVQPVNTDTKIMVPVVYPLVNSLADTTLEVTRLKEENTKLRAELKVYSDTVTKMNEISEKQARECEEVKKQNLDITIKKDKECVEKIAVEVKKLTDHYEALLKEKEKETK